MRKSMLTGLCLLIALPAWGQRAGGFGGGMGSGRGGFGHAGVGRGTVVGFGTPGVFSGLGAPFNSAFRTPGVFASFGTPFGFGFGSPFAGFGVPFGFGFGTGVFANVRAPFILGIGTSQNVINAGIPPLGGLSSLGLNAPASAFFNGILAADTFPGWSLPFYPFGYGGYGGYGYDMTAQASPNIIVIQPMTPEMMGQRQQKPPEPAKLEIRDVNVSTTAQAPAAPLTPQQMFSIALRNGTTDSAMAAWVQDDCLYYLNARGRKQQVALAAVDRNMTERLNSQKNMSIWLPPE